MLIGARKDRFNALFVAVEEAECSALLRVPPVHYSTTVGKLART